MNHFHSQTYFRLQLGFDDIAINSLKIEYQDAKNGSTKNELKTFYEDTDFNLQYGLNFRPQGSVFARVKHLQHSKFRYVFDVQNNSGTMKTGTVRIFLSHKLGSLGDKLTFPELRSLMMELDRFEVICK